MSISRRGLSTLLDASYEDNQNAERLAQQEGYRLDPTLSNREHKVFLDQYDNPVVAYTGTRKFGDFVTDTALALGIGNLTKRYSDSRKVAKAVTDKYGKNALAIGHSLGGYLAENSGLKRVITVNKGAGLGDIGKKIGRNQTDIRTATDPVSLLSVTQSGGKKITVPNSVYLRPLVAHGKDKVNKLKQNHFQ